MGWLVDDEVSAYTHRGFCLPWRVKPRLSERAPPQALDPLCCTALPGPRHMDTTWREGPSPGLETEQAMLQPAPPSTFSSSASSLPTCLPAPSINLG